MFLAISRNVHQILHWGNYLVLYLGNKIIRQINYQKMSQIQHLFNKSLMRINKMIIDLHKYHLAVNRMLTIQNVYIAEKNLVKMNYLL